MGPICAIRAGAAFGSVARGEAADRPRRRERKKLSARST